MGFDFSAFRVKKYSTHCKRRESHLQIRGYYCGRPENHSGPCPMIATRATRFGNWLNESVDWILDIIWEAAFDRH